jgi:hypothetical protein
LALTEHDVEQFAARIRLHFESHLRDIAYELALGIGSIVGPKVKMLSPETTLKEIVDWIKEHGPISANSLDRIEWVMAIEAELGFEVPDELAARMEEATFRELVLNMARKKKLV